MPEQLQDVIELRLPPDPRYIAVVRLAAAGVASRCEMSVEDIDDLKVAVSEIFTNTIDHAYEGVAARSVLVRLLPGQSELRIEVIDEGVGFEVDRQSFEGEPDVSGNGGLGLYLVHQYMDDVKIESAPGSGTRVIMTKRLAR